MKTLLLAILLTASAIAAPAENREEYLLGEVRTLSAAGALLSSDVYLVKRSVRPTAGLVEVRTTLVPKSGPTAPYVATFRVTGPTFVVSDPEATYRGSGTWTGEPWRWKTWRYDIVWPDGSGGLSGEDTATDTHIKLTKRYRDAAGMTTKLVAGDLARITSAAYEILQRRLVP